MVAACRGSTLPPIFAALLDDNDGGQFTIGPTADEAGVQRYLAQHQRARDALRDERRLVSHSRLRAPLHALRAVLSSDQTGAHRRADRRHAAHPRPLRSGARLVASAAARRARLAPRRLSWATTSELRLTTDAPLSYLNDEPFASTGRKHFVLAWGAPVEEPLESLCERFLRETVRYWQQWVKHCDIPPIFQGEVIRSALALKLHCFEDTGAIVAALTTSLPEAPGSGRTWDYRYCWLRDSYYTLGAFQLLGHFEEREQFLQFLINVASSAPDLDLAPLYRIDGKTDLDEAILDALAGLRRREAGARRQRRGAAPAARRVRRDGAWR